MNRLINVVTLKWGNRYRSDYANRLRRSVARNLGRPHRFICFTDNFEGLIPGIEVYPIPEIDLPAERAITGWRKLCLFRDDLPLEGLCLFLDLDLVLTGPLDDFFTFGEPEEIPIIHNWVAGRKKILRNDPQIGNSSVFRFEANQCRFVWDQFNREKDWALANFHPPQSYLTHCIRPRMRFWPEEWVRSFKRHCRPVFPFNLFFIPRLPKGARIIAFHGKPDPDEVIDGFRGERLHHRVRPTPWVKYHWQ